MYEPWCSCQKEYWQKHKQPVNIALARLAIPGKNGVFIGCARCFKIDWTRSYIDVEFQILEECPLIEVKSDVREQT